jgi:hypothetical protein
MDPPDLFSTKIYGNYSDNKMDRNLPVPNDFYELPGEHHIHTVEDIDELYAKCVALERMEIEIQIVVIERPISEKLLAAGFVPYTFMNKEAVINWYKYGGDIKTLEYWQGPGRVRDVRNIAYVKVWHFRTMDYYKLIGLRTGGNDGLYIFYKHLLYKSNRVKTDMGLFRSPGNHAISKKKLNAEGTVVLDGEVWNTIPVTRYAGGMSRGAFFRKSKETFCGTFYYHEPESTTLLAYKTSITAFNKTDALLKLGITNARTSRIKMLQSHMDGTLPADLMMTPLEYYEAGLADKAYTSIEEVSRITQTKYYVGMLPSIDLYASEDWLDQELCLALKEKAIDVAILTHMVGSHQVVTEVLDSRIRAESLMSLIYID